MQKALAPLGSPLSCSLGLPVCTSHPDQLDPHVCRRHEENRTRVILHAPPRGTALILALQWPRSIRKWVCLGFSSFLSLFSVNPISFLQNDMNLYPETCEMTTIRLQTLLIKAGLDFFFLNSFVALFFFLDFCYSQSLLRLVCRQCFQAEIKRNRLLISALGNKATIVCFISEYLQSGLRVEGWRERD